MEKLLANIQASRNAPVPVLYGNDLQENTGIYYAPERKYLKLDVPDAPKALFCENGATTEIDNRPFIQPAPQVPRNPELEALNDYFNQQRINEFARQRDRAIVPEYLQKQVELNANALVRDEIERRTGIRKSVLEATGLTPAQVQLQLAQEAVSSVNGKVLDIRDRQVQDAVNMYYTINNLPQPATTLQTPEQVPTSVAPAETGGKQPSEDENAMGFGAGDGDMDGGDTNLEETMEGATGKPPLPELDGVGFLSKRQLIELIVAYNIVDPAITTRAGNRMTGGSIERTLSKDALISIVENYIRRQGDAGGSNARFGATDFA